MTPFFRFANIALASTGGHVLAYNLGLPLAWLIGSLFGGAVAFIAMNTPQDS